MNKEHSSNGKTAKLTAVNATTGNQETNYVYGTTLANSAVASNDLLVGTIYPDSTDSTDRVAMTYNRQGQPTTTQDQNGTVHSPSYDLLGRPVSDAVALAAGVDATVQRIDTAYEVRGMVNLITSYQDIAGTVPVNQVQLTYNAFRQLASDAQEHGGLVTGSTPTVNYAYATGISGNTIRLLSITYPNSSVLGFGYGSSGSANDLLSRVQNLTFNAATVANYAYLGLGMVVNVNYPQPGVTMALNDGLGNYPGLDIFGRVIDVLWSKVGSLSSSSSSSSSSGATAALVDLGWGYDQASNRTYRQDFVAETFGQPFDEKYDNDGLYRLKKFQRGTLVDGVITNPGLQQAWGLDATGNWKDFAQFDPANNATNTFDQQRTSNAANEIIDLVPTVGGTWATPGYDRNGNMTTMPQPKDPSAAYTATPDAWNRLMKLADSTTALTVQQNQYDGRNFRTIRETFSSGVLAEARDYYYTSSWQVACEFVLGMLDRQYVWGVRYIDDLVTRIDTARQLYALQDANWNVVGICDTSGNVLERYAYSAYGVCSVLNPDFSVKTGGTAYDWTVLYTGRALDWATGLQDSRNRFYLALLGVFVGRDRIGIAGGANLYQYADGGPTGSIDPFGLHVTKEELGAAKEFQEWQERHDRERLAAYKAAATTRIQAICTESCICPHSQCTIAKCMAEATQIADAYCDMWWKMAKYRLRQFLITPASFLTLGWKEDDWSMGWLCYQWQALTFNSIKSLVRQSSCFHMARVGHAVGPKPYVLAHNWVALTVGCEPDKNNMLSTTGRCGPCTAWLDPWTDGLPSVFSFDPKTGFYDRRLYKRSNDANFLGTSTGGPADRPTGVTGTVFLPDGSNDSLDIENGWSWPYLE